MKNYDMAGLRGMVEQMPTEQLDEMLKYELEKEPVDEAAVKLIMGILEERDRDVAVEMNERVAAAWEKYQMQIPVQTHSKPFLQRWPVRVAAAVVVIVALTFLIPQNAEAGGFWERLTHWTDSIFAFLEPGSEPVDEEYMFKTDNEGLQQVYDTVTALGITDPVVPMWLPDGYALIECKLVEAPTKTFVYACFSSNTNQMILDIALCNTESSRQYNKDESSVNTHEIAGVVHNILHNNNRWTAAWTRERLECAIYMDCQEEIIYKVLKSIYTMEAD